MTDKQLLSRAHRELLDVLNSINQDKIHHDGDAFHELLNDVEKALAEHAMRETQRLGQEIEQEPVAWYYPDGSPDQCTTNKAYAEMEPAWTPLYTHLPQRTEQEPDELNIAYMSGLYDGKKKRPWVGLTVDELITLEQKHIRHEDLCRAIEAKLKEKNT